MARIYAIEDLVPVVDPDAFVHPTAVLIGDVIVGPDCYVGPGASLRGDFGRIILKAGSNLQDNCVMHGFPGTDTTISSVQDEMNEGKGYKTILREIVRNTESPRHDKMGEGEAPKAKTAKLVSDGDVSKSDSTGVAKPAGGNSKVIRISKSNSTIQRR